ncbi:hypothetical protein JCM19038_1420 [Geomicrobium sp. JCM 19038]|nr:hypothetical protein JCM19038_1420 [Geomicrobium sp. JCM 19038]
MKVQLSSKERIDQYINENQTELIEAIQEAVRIKSVVGTEQEMIHFMKQKYEDLGLETVIVQPDYEKIQDHEASQVLAYPLITVTMSSASTMVTPINDHSRSKVTLMSYLQNRPSSGRKTRTPQSSKETVYMVVVLWI